MRKNFCEEIRAWKKARIKANFEEVLKKISGKQIIFNDYAERKLLSIEDGAKYISSILDSDSPCMIARYGSVELDAMVSAIAYPDINPKYLKRCIQKGYIFANAGVFPKEISEICYFSEIMKTSSRFADYIGVWFIPMEDYVIKTFANKNTTIGLLRSIEPWYAEEPWTRVLAGKKVLVIHPFNKTIEMQYKKRALIFSNPNILPDFELKTFKSVQTAGGGYDNRFSSWHEAFEYMKKEVMAIDFDIAIIGCGAYGFPLAAEIKKAGKKAVHMGGATQILFGIKGKRWDNHPIISGLYNKAWVRPLEEEKPIHADLIEDACYW